MNILLMDDSATSRMLFKMHMPKEYGHIIHESHDGASAIKKALEIKPDLIVLDYNMPDMTGVQVALEMKAQGIAATMVLLTANTQDSVLEETKAAGIFRVIEKPINGQKLKGLLEEIAT